MIYTLRPSLPSDYDRMAELLTSGRHVPMTADALRQQDALLPPNALRHRVVAANIAGGVMGFGEAFRWPHTRVGKFYVTVVSDPATRGQGIGRALLDEVEGFAYQHGGTLLVGEVREQDPASLAFVQRRGYQIRRHAFESLLDLAEVDHSLLAPVVQSVLASGIHFFTLAESPGEATERRLYELLSRTMPDLPGYEAEEFMSFDVWRAWMVESALARPDGVILAADGERLVGVTTMEFAPDSVYTPHTSVDRAYRGRRIGLALKLLAIQRARQQGVRLMRTGNDSQNSAMLAINQRLGFVPVAGDYEVGRQLS